MTQARQRRFSKKVEFEKLDEENQTATGAVLVPWEVDHQRDWLTPEAIESMHNPHADEGVMHAGFPEDAAETEYYILDEPETVGGPEYPAGTLMADRTYHDDELWSLVEDGILTGFSIGGDVTAEEEYDIDELPDEVVFPDGVERGPATEIQNGAIDEVSDVDIPAVPRAMHTTAKGLRKNVFEDADGRNEFVSRMEDRGHTEEDAERLFDYLEAVEKYGPAEAVAKFVEKHEMNGDTDEPDDATKWRKFKNWLTDSDDDTPGELKGMSEGHMSVFQKAVDVCKEGRTLNSENRQALMAAHDAIEATLSSDVDHEWNRFTDDARYSFDLTQYSEKKEEDYGDKSKSLEKLTNEQSDLVMEVVEEFERTQGEATFGDFRDWAWMKLYDDWDKDKSFAIEAALDEFRSWTREMHDSLPVSDEFVDWIDNETDSELNMSNDDNPELEEKVDSLADKVDSLQSELGKANDGDEGTEKDGSGDDTPLAEKVDSIAEKVDDIEERVDKVSKETAETGQLGGTDDSASEKDAVHKENEVFTR